MRIIISSGIGTVFAWILYHAYWICYSKGFCFVWPPIYKSNLAIYLLLLVLPLPILENLDDEKNLEGKEVIARENDTYHLKQDICENDKESIIKIYTKQINLKQDYPGKPELTYL